MDLRRLDQRTPLALIAIAALGAAVIGIGFLSGRGEPSEPGTPTPTATPSTTPTPVATATPDAEGFLPAERDALATYAASVGWKLTGSCDVSPAEGENELCLFKPRRGRSGIVVEAEAGATNRTYTLVQRRGPDGEPVVVSAVLNPPVQEQVCPVNQRACAFGLRAAALASTGDVDLLLEDWPATEYTCPGAAPLCDGAPAGEVRRGFEVWDGDTKRVLDRPAARDWLTGALTAGGGAGWRLASVACGSAFPEPADCSKRFATVLVAGDGPMLILGTRAGDHGLASKVVSAHLLDPQVVDAIDDTVYPAAEGALFDTYRTFRPITPTFEGPLHPRGTASGIPIVDEAVRAIESGDREALGGLIQYTAIPCQPARNGPVTAPVCRDQQPNELNPVLPIGWCGESDYARPEEFEAVVDRLTAGNPRLYAVTELPGIPELGLYPSGPFAAILGVEDAANRRRGIIVYLDGSGISGIDFGCAGGPDALLAANPNQLRLPPPQ